MIWGIIRAVVTTYDKATNIADVEIFNTGQYRDRGRRTISISTGRRLTSTTPLVTGGYSFVGTRQYSPIRSIFIRKLPMDTRQSPVASERRCLRQTTGPSDIKQKKLGISEKRWQLVRKVARVETGCLVLAFLGAAVSFAFLIDESDTHNF